MEGFVVGCLIMELLQSVLDLVLCIIMICGLVFYMDFVEQGVKVFGVMCFFKEKFFMLVVEMVISGLKFIKLQLVQEFYVLIGMMLLEVLESNKVLVVVVCWVGVCGCCKIKVVFGDYMVSSIMMLSEVEIVEGYVLVCFCYLQGDFVFV